MIGFSRKKTKPTSEGARKARLGGHDRTRVLKEIFVHLTSGVELCATCWMPGLSFEKQTDTSIFRVLVGLCVFVE